MTDLEIVNKCREILLKNLGFTCKEDEIIIDSCILSVNNDELYKVYFRVMGGKHFAYYYNALRHTFMIDSLNYDSYLVN